MWSEDIRGQGFSIIPNIVAASAIAQFLREFETCPVARSRAGIRHAMKLPAVRELACRPEVLGIARAVLGESPFPFRATLFDKSTDSNWLVVWHQDTALPLQGRRDAPGWGPWSIKDGIVYAHAPADVLGNVLALRIHLDDSTADNGPLRVLPETHDRGILSDESIRDFVGQISPVDCLVHRGGILAMRPLLIHASSKIRGTGSRRVLHIEYAAGQAVGEELRLEVA